jgi:hypothetical protein
MEWFVRDFVEDGSQLSLDQAKDGSFGIVEKVALFFERSDS